jgi:hypothetical protein
MINTSSLSVEPDRAQISFPKADFELFADRPNPLGQLFVHELADHCEIGRVWFGHLNTCQREGFRRGPPPTSHKIQDSFMVRPIRPAASRRAVAGSWHAQNSPWLPVPYSAFVTSLQCLRIAFPLLDHPTIESSMAVTLLKTVCQSLLESEYASTHALFVVWEFSSATNSPTIAYDP